MNSNAQTAQDGFGKNRIQYYSLDWKFISSNSIDLYFYTGGEKLSKTAIEIAENEFRKVSDLFGFTPFSKIKIFLYLSSNDRLMSNLGLGENSNLTGGKTNFTKSTIEAAYEGSLINLKKQISAGISQILIRDMLFGGSFKDAVQNSYLLTLPDWFVGGAIKYSSEGWSSDMEDFIKEIGNTKRMRQPANYVGKESYLIGQSIWNFIAERYGRSSIGNILNLTRIIRNEENAISGTLGMPFPTFLKEWKKFYQIQYQTQSSFLNEPSKSKRIGNNYLKKNYNQLSISHDGEYLAFSQSWKGKFQVVAYNLNTKKSHVIFRGGSKAKHQNFEGEFPVLNFGSKNEIWIAYPSKGKWKGICKSVRGNTLNRIEIFKDFHEIYGLSISPDSKKMVFSASKNGFSDIFLLNIDSEKLKTLSDDFYDDLDPVFSITGDSILFSSNRPISDSLPIEKTLPDFKRKYSLFYQTINQPFKPTLFSSNTGNIIKPHFDKNGKLFCLTDESGVYNISTMNPKGQADSKGQTLTSSKFSILDYAYHPETNRLVFNSLSQLKPRLFFENNFDPSPLTLPEFKQKQEIPDTLLKTISKAKTLFSDSNFIDIRNYVFDDEKPENQGILPIKPQRKKMERAKLKKESKLLNVEITGPFNYQPTATANYLTTGLVVNPIPSWGLGALVDFSMHDIFENHRFNGGMTYFFSDMEIRNNNAFLEYQYLKKRVDFKVKAERMSIQNSGINQLVRWRDVLTGVTASASYPFSNALRIEASPYFQTTRRSIFNQNAALFGGPDQSVFYWGLKGELVFDNTTVEGLNMITGTRLKIRSQYQAANRYSKKGFGEIFMDFRTYQPIHKEIILAFRTSYGHFFGPGSKKFMLGGMDNWLFRSYEVSKEKDDPLRGLNQNNPILASDEALSDWLFNRFATNLRGFKYNSIYGSSFLLFNGELRVPIVRYIYKGPINSNFWRNLQLTTFTDIGSAWTGVGPFNSDNSLNTKVVNEGNFSIKVKSYENPFLIGYGFGARTLVLGYYLKFDVAWGRQNGFTNDPRYYFTFGYDF